MRYSGVEQPDTYCKNWNANSSSRSIWSPILHQNKDVRNFIFFLFTDTTRVEKNYAQTLLQFHSLENVVLLFHNTYNNVITDIIVYHYRRYLQKPLLSSARARSSLTPADPSTGMEKKNLNEQCSRGAINKSIIRNYHSILRIVIQYSQ